jgi:hypothetical protein
MRSKSELPYSLHADIFILLRQEKIIRFTLNGMIFIYIGSKFILHETIKLKL